jgi:hypothetical protein
MRRFGDFLLEIAIDFARRSRAHFMMWPAGLFY